MHNARDEDYFGFLLFTLVCCKTIPQYYQMNNVFNVNVHTCFQSDADTFTYYGKKNYKINHPETSVAHRLVLFKLTKSLHPLAYIEKLLLVYIRKK